MTLNLSPLLARAFLTAEAARATAALGEAREQSGGRSWEIVVPPEPDLAWLEGTLLRTLVYFCEATRAPLPACAGVFVSLFAGDRLCCVRAAEVIRFACDTLGVSPEELVRRYGTGEVRHALPHPGANGKRT
ncbi:MAG: STAUR_1299 family protein [Minicystis sp.]